MGRDLCTHQLFEKKMAKIDFFSFSPSLILLLSLFFFPSFVWSSRYPFHFPRAEITTVAEQLFPRAFARRTRTRFGLLLEKSSNTSGSPNVLHVKCPFCRSLGSRGPLSSANRTLAASWLSSTFELGNLVFFFLLLFFFYFSSRLFSSSSSSFHHLYHLSFHFYESTWDI